VPSQIRLVASLEKFSKEHVSKSYRFFERTAPILSDFFAILECERLRGLVQEITPSHQAVSSAARQILINMSYWSGRFKNPGGNFLRSPGERGLVAQLLAAIRLSNRSLD